MESTLLAAALPGSLPCVRRNLWEESVKGQVKSFVARLLSGGPAMEKRRDGRRPFPMLMRLSPVEPHTLAPAGEPIVVVGKNLSDNGLGFFHPQPFPYRNAIVTLEDAAGRSLSLLLDISWCRFTRQGWYDSGGRFLQVVSLQAS